MYYKGQTTDLIFLKPWTVEISQILSTEITEQLFDLPVGLVPEVKF